MNIRRPMCYIAVGFLLFCLIIIYSFHLIPESFEVFENINDSDTVCVIGTITDKVIKDGKAIIYLKAARGYIAYLTPQQNDLIMTLPVGSRIRVQGKLYRFDTAETYGQFNTREYYYIRGYNARLVGCSVDACDYKSGLKEELWKIKESVKCTFDKYLDEDDAGIMSAIILGDKTDLNPQIKELYQASGIIHILSLSGLHIATLGLGLMKLLTALIRKVLGRTRLCDDINRGGRKSLLVAGLISSVTMVMYCTMTGSNVSTIRALVMYVIGLVAALIGRSYDLLSAAAFSSVVAVVINPMLVFDAGFQLSFMAVVSIGVILPRVTGLFKIKSNNKIMQGVFLSLSIQIGTFPIVAYHYYQIPLAGLILNLVVVPLMSVVLMCGIAMAAFGNIISVAAMIFGKITHVILMLYQRTAMLFANRKWNIIVTGKPKIIQVIIYYCVILGIIACIDKLNDVKEATNIRDLAHENIDQSGRLIIGHKAKNKRRAETLILCGFTMIACVIVMLGHHKGYIIHNLSVGQGDCTVIRNKTHVIIADCGSSTEEGVGRYRLIPFLKANKITNIDVLFISHFDSDHVNGILELLEDDFYKHRIRNIIISKAALVYDGETENYNKLIDDSITCDIPIYTISAGTSFVIGDSVVRCLSPDPYNINEYGDTNNASMVLSIVDSVSGYHILLTGDIGEDTEAKLCNVISGSHFDYIKIAHHGSNSSTSQAFLESIDFALRSDSYKPICVISVGRGNRYGHPGTSTLNRLRMYYPDASIFRTDLDNEVVTCVR